MWFWHSSFREALKHLSFTVFLIFYCSINLMKCLLFLCRGPMDIQLQINLLKTLLKVSEEYL
jgi:hypothetical protein